MMRRARANGKYSRRFDRLLLVIGPLVIAVLIILHSSQEYSGLVDAPLSAVMFGDQQGRKDPLDLHHLTQANYTSCPETNLVWISNIHKSSRQIRPALKIPRIVHQTSKSRCVTQKIGKAIAKWHFNGWSYFFHEDNAVMRLLQQEFPEFPHLSLIARKCLIHGTLKADLWRYVLLWVYGGIYADLDAVPAKFTAATLQPTDDAFFVVEQYHLLSQWFMAVSPRHPLMYYAVHHSLSRLLDAPDTGAIPASMFTGPHALHAAYIEFRKDAGEFVDSASIGKKPVWAGHFRGSCNRTVTVVGAASDQNEYVNRDFLGVLKKNEYRKMSMRHFQEDKNHPSGQSCLSAMLNAYAHEFNSSPF